LRFLVAILALFSVALASPELRIAAAANLSQVLPELASAYKTHHPQTKIEITYGASGTLSQQIARGAPYDVFLSASPEYISYLEGRGLVKGRRTIARGKLVLFYHKRILPPPKGPADLKRNDVRRIVVANPEHAPFGAAAIACLKNYGIYEEIKAKLIYAANVSQAAQMAVHGADAALISLSLALNPNLKKTGSYVELPESCHAPLYQEAAALSDREASISFLDFLTSTEAQSILRQFGYESP